MKTIERDFSWDSIEEQIDSLEPVEKANWRHGHRDAYVFEAEGKHWRIWIDVHHEDGWQLTKIVRATQVRPEERKVIEWVAVPADTSSTGEKA